MRYAINKDFGPWLKQEIKDLGYTQSEFAKMINIEQPHLSRIISGDRGVSVDVLENISRVLHKPLSVVLQKAGILNEQPESNQLIDEITYSLRQLGIDDLDEVLEIVKLKLDKKHKAKRKGPEKSPALSN